MPSQDAPPPSFNPQYVDVRYNPEFKDVVIRANRAMWKYLENLALYLSTSNSVGYHHHIDDFSVGIFEGNIPHLVLEYNEPPGVFLPESEMKSEDSNELPWMAYVDVRYHAPTEEVVIRANHDAWELLAEIAGTLATSQFVGRHYHVDDLVIDIFGGNVSDLILEYNEPPHEPPVDFKNPQ